MPDTPPTLPSDAPTDTPSDPVAFLEAEANASREALARTFAEFKSLLTLPSSRHPADGSPGGMGKMLTDHPLTALGGGAAAGFLAAALLVPSKEQQALKRLAALERAVALHGPDTAQPRPGRGPSGALLDALVGVVKPAILHTLTATLAAKTAATATDPTEKRGRESFSPEPRSRPQERGF